MHLQSIHQLAFRNKSVALIIFVSLTLCSCSRRVGTQDAGVATHGIARTRLEKSVQSDQVWTDRLLYQAVEGLTAGKTSEVVGRLQKISASIDNVQLSEDGVDCVEPILLEYDKISQKLVRFSEQCGVDSGLIRFVPVDEKSGFLRAMIIIVNEYEERQSKTTTK